MSEAMIAKQSDTFDAAQVVADLNRLLRLRTTPIGLKLFATKAEMEAIPRIRRPRDIHTTDQIIGQAARNGWTVGITGSDLVGAQCATVIGGPVVAPTSGQRRNVTTFADGFSAPKVWRGSLGLGGCMPWTSPTQPPAGWSSCIARQCGASQRGDRTCSP